MMFPSTPWGLVDQELNSDIETCVNRFNWIPLNGTYWGEEKRKYEQLTAMLISTLNWRPYYHRLILEHYPVKSFQALPEQMNLND